MERSASAPHERCELQFTRRSLSLVSVLHVRENADQGQENRVMAISARSRTPARIAAPNASGAGPPRQSERGRQSIELPSARRIARGQIRGEGGGENVPSLDPPSGTAVACLRITRRMPECSREAQRRSGTNARSEMTRFRL